MAGGDLLATPEAGPAAIRGGGLRVAGFLVSLVLQVVASALLFRHLGVADTGRYVTVLALVAIVGGLSDAGLTAIGVRELSVRDPAERASLARNLHGMRIVLTLAGLAGAVAFGLIAGYEGVMIAGTLLAGLGMLFTNIQATLSISLMSRLKMGWVTVADVLRQAVQVVVILAGVAAGAGLLVFFGAPIPASLAALVLTAVLVRHDIPLMPAFHPHVWRGLLRDVLPFAVAAAAAVLYFRVAILLVSLIASEQETGYFGVSSRVVEALVAIPTLMVGAAFPIFARAAMDDHVRLAYGFDRTLRVSVAAGVGVALGLLFGAPIAIDVLGGSGFEPAIEVLRIQGVAVGATFVSAFWGYAMLSLRLHREIMFVSIAALILVFVLVAVLCSADGARGAAVGTAIAELAIAVGYPLVLGRRHPDLVPRAGFLRGVAGAAAVAAAVWFVPVGPLLQTVLGLAVYGVALVVLRALPEEVLVELRRLTGRGRRPAPG